VGREGGRGPQQLRFRTLLEKLAEGANLIPDQRRESSVHYQLADCYRSAWAMFYLQDPSLLEFQRRFQDENQRNNISTVFGVEKIPCDSQLRDVIDSHDYIPLRGVFDEYLYQMQRSKVLEKYRFYDGKYLLTVDGSEYFNSEKVQCKRCLSRKKSSGEVELYHQAVQPAIVHPEFRQVLPLAPEFIRMQDGSNKQDCEINASRRLLERLRADHPQLPLIVVADSLYSNAPTIKQIVEARMSFLLVAKPGDHKSLFDDIEGLRRGKMLERKRRVENRGKSSERRYHYEWTNAVALGVAADSPVVNYMQLTITKADGKRTFTGSWVTDMQITDENVQQLVRGARARWKIENEGFNTLKNQGYHLEHNFGHGAEHLSEAFFTLNLLAFFVHQILSLVDGLYQKARAGFSSRVEFWAAIRATFRMFFFASWDEVLERMNAPPIPHRP
jgi:hypothetical protein